MTRLLGAAAAFAGTVVGGFIAGVLLDRATGANWWVLVGLLAGVVVGIAAIAAALRPLMKSDRG